jgi:hypothetical protein
MRKVEMNQREITIPCGTSVLIRCEAPKENRNEVLETKRNTNNSTEMIPPTIANTNKNESSQPNTSNIPGVVPLLSPQPGNTVEKTNMSTNRNTTKNNTKNNNTKNTNNNKNNTNKNNNTKNTNNNKNNTNKNNNTKNTNNNNNNTKNNNAKNNNAKNTNTNKNKNTANSDQPVQAPEANVAPTAIPAPEVVMNTRNGLKRKRNNNKNNTSMNKTKKAKRN